MLMSSCPCWAWRSRRSSSSWPQPAVHENHGHGDAGLDGGHGDRADRPAPPGPRGKWPRTRRDYLKYLAQTRQGTCARRAQAAGRPALPAPRTRAVVVGGGRGQTGVGAARRATRTSGRYGSGSGRSSWPLRCVAPETAPVDELEPLTAGAMQQFLACTARWTTCRWRSRCVPSTT